MALPVLSDVVTTYLYGSTGVPGNFVNPGLIRPEGQLTALPAVSALEFMEGPGRFALAASFELVGDFFDDVNGYDVAQLFGDETGNEVRLTKEQWANVLGLTSYGLNIDHKDFDDGQDNFSERVFLWGNTSFQISDAEFVVTRTMNQDGSYIYTRAIENFAVIPRLDTGENFDFVSGDGTTTQTQHVSRHAIDPSGIGRKVTISFNDDVPRETFTEEDYWDSVSDFGSLGYSQFEYSIPRQWQLQGGTQQIFDSLFSGGISSAVEIEKLVVYGTDEADTFAIWTTPVGINLLQQYESAGPYSFLMPQFEVALNGLIYVAGGGNDVVNGTTADDVLFGNEGADSLFGGGGDDFIFFDAADGPNVNGGAGRDAAWLIGDDAINFDMTTNEIEVLVGGGGNDTISAGTSPETLIISGGTGADVFNVSYGGGEGTRILWGGAGADTFDFTHTGDYSSEAYQLGVLVASVSGLTVANLAEFTLSMLGLPVNFNWGKIDVVILNPDAGDRVSLDGQIIDASPYTEEIWAVTSFDEDGFQVYGQVAAIEGETAIRGTSDVLGPTMEIQSPERDTIETQWFRDEESPHTALWGGMETGQETVDWARDAMMALYGQPAVTWQVDLSNAQGAQAGGNGEGWVGRLAAGWDDDYTPDQFDSWFVAGGMFEQDTLLANNAVTANMGAIAGISTDWLVS